MSSLRIATRRSALAVWQAEHIASVLEARGHYAELLTLQTEGDRILDRALAQIGGKGLFVKELEQALIDGRADLAVHSAKDVPYSLPPDLTLCAIPERDDPRDALVSPEGRTFAHLKHGARVGTSSLRRAMQLQAARPDLQIVPVRGNVQTRLLKAIGAPRPDRLDAVVLAYAGLKRLKLDAYVTEILPVELSLPAAGQGALAIEVLVGSRAGAICGQIDDALTARCVRAERAVLQSLSGSCTVPIGAHAVVSGGSIWLRAVLGGPDGRGGTRLIRAEARGGAPEALGRHVADDLLHQGGGALLAAAPRGPRLAAPVHLGETA